MSPFAVSEALVNTANQLGILCRDSKRVLVAFADSGYATITMLEDYQGPWFSAITRLP